MSVGKSIGALGLVVTLAACADYAATGPQGGPLVDRDDPEDPVLQGYSLVRLYDNLPSPGQITIPAGTVVEWKNAGANVHSVSNYSTHPEAETWEDVLVEPGGEFFHVFAEPGEYGFVCIFHQEVGYITVVPSPADSTNMDDMTHLVP